MKGDDYYPFEEEIHIFCFRVDHQVVDLLILDFLEDLLVGCGRSLAQEDLNWLGCGHPDQVLQFE